MLEHLISVLKYSKAETKVLQEKDTIAQPWLLHIILAHIQIQVAMWKNHV